MHRRLIVGLLVALLCTVTFGVTVAALESDSETELDSTGAVLQMDEFTDTAFEIEVFENGDGRWTIRYMQPLETEEDESDFEEFAERFETEETDTFADFRDRATRLTEGGTDATGREMSAEDFEREAFIDPRGQTTGVVSLSFRWTNMAVDQGDQVVLGDIFAGGWSIIENQRVVVRPGPDLEFATIPVPEPDSGLEGVSLSEASSVTYAGPTEFTDERPRVVFEPADDSDGTADTDESPSETSGDDGTADTVGDDTETSVPGEENGDNGTGMIPLAVAALLLVGIGGGLAWYATVRTRNQLSTTEYATASTSAPAEQDTDMELLSDEDRVQKLLERNDGRMKQVEIVEETEWSKSKVSMLLSQMEEDGHISKLRVGRENIISLSGEEPDAAGSPFDTDE